jgi:hypothetical protein
MNRMLCALAFGAILLASPAALADQAVSVGGAMALLNKPATPSASLILIPGGDGHLGVNVDGSFSGLRDNQLVRTRKAYLAHGLATLTIDSGVNVAEAVAYMRKVARPVVVAGTSRGTLRVPSALAGKPDGIVLTAGFLDQVKSAIGSPGSLPRTLIVHHRQDGCRSTPPSAVEPFRAWGGSRVRVAWMEGGLSSGDPCKARAHHGFNGLDRLVVSTVAQFAVSAR